MLVAPVTPPCRHGVVSVVAENRSQEAAVALHYLPFLYGWKPTAAHWECPTAISSGSTASAVHFLQRRVDCQARSLVKNGPFYPGVK